MTVQLTAQLVESFAGVFLSPMYDNPAPTPQFHRECWEMYCSPAALVAAAAPRGHAKAQPLTARALTPYGWKAIGDLEVGDRVVGRDGQARTVTHLHPISRLEVYEVSTRDGRKTRCNDEHLWTVIVPQNTGEMERTVPLKNLFKDFSKSRYDPRDEQTRTEYKYFLPLPDAVHFAPLGIRQEVDPYTLGLWLGDGHSEGGRITSADPEIFEYVPYDVTRTWSGKYLYRVEGLTSKLSALGVLNNKHVPEDYLYGDLQTRISLLQGLMDTDGTCHQDGKIAYFCNTNWLLISAVVSLVRGLGGVAVINENETTCNGKVFDSWRVSVKLPAVLNPFRLKRKSSMWVYDAAKRQTITGIEHVGSDLCRCITVSGDGHYLTDDYLVTHNSTALTHDFGLAAALFRFEPHIMVVSATEELAMSHLIDMAKELRENDDLRREFGVQKFLTDSKGEIVIRCDDGYEFRILARGAGQKLRGLKWNGRRPGLILCDDMEEDEQVESADRRKKFSRWVLRALIPMGRKGCRIRWHGTILHQDSMLARIMKSEEWVKRLYRAHKSFDDFSEILWPELWNERELKKKRQLFIEDQDAAGYSQEYLNDPHDNEDAYLRKEWFLPMEEEDHDVPKLLCAGVDFAISKKDSANRTSITVGGQDTLHTIHFVDERVGRWDSEQIIEELFTVQQRWHPDVFFVEDGQIWKALWPTIKKEMLRSGKFLNFVPRTPISDKASRGRAFQKRMKAGACRFDKEASWYAGYEEELLRFTGVSEAKLDDQFDSSALLVLGLEEMADAEPEDFDSDEEIDMRCQDPRHSLGRSPVTGY